MAAERALREKDTLAASCGDYLLMHRSALSENHIHESLLRIYQKDGQTLSKTLISLRVGGQPTHGIKTYSHESLVFLNSGLLHLFRMTHLSGGETDLGLMIIQRPRFPSTSVMYGHALTSSVILPGRVMPSPIMMRKIAGNVLDLYRQHCGAWSLDDPHIDDATREFFKTGKQTG
ncbi:hypothetical protein [Celeribacter sp.]|uniref:hypothetical protein n=1 Tax=Celeribacter sp. TaxID=1890673 RepID=UPI003A9122DC